MQPILFINNSTNEPVVVTESLKVKKPIIKQRFLTIASGSGAAPLDLLPQITEGECAAYGGQILNPGCYDLQVSIKYIDETGCDSCSDKELSYSCETFIVPKSSVFPLPDGFYTSVKVGTVDSNFDLVANTQDVKVSLYSAHQPDCESCVASLPFFDVFEDSGQIIRTAGAGYEQSINVFPPNGVNIWVWNIDNNFNVSVNDESIATVKELNFEPDKLPLYLEEGTADNLQFANGDLLFGGRPWNYPSGSEEPLIKIFISPAGVVTLQGWRSAGVYENMVFQNGATFRTIPIPDECTLKFVKFGQSNASPPTNITFRMFAA